MALFIVPQDLTSSVASRRAKSGQLLALARGVYVDDTHLSHEEAAERCVYEIVGRVMPGAVVTGRSAVEGRLAVARDGSRQLVVAHPTRVRDLQLPGLLVQVRRGPEPLEGDQPYMADGLYVASRARALLENVARSRTSSRRVAATLSAAELEEWMDRLARTLGVHGLASLRAQVDELATYFDSTAHGKAARLIGAAQGTQPSRTGSKLAVYAAGHVDSGRLDLFDVLAKHLAARAPQVRLERPATSAMLPLFDAYFSNFIEGTEFEVDEAVGIVLDGTIPANRPKDAHDILGTFRIVSDHAEMRSRPQDADAFLDRLLRWHAVLLGARPEMNPGQFKKEPNWFGTFKFVDPDAVVGTLRAGWDRINELRDPFGRAVMAMFVVAEVHPFDDGNGRTTRLAANVELVSAGMGRLVIPTVLRSSYLKALRALSVNKNPEALLSVCDFAQRWTLEVDWSSVAAAKADLEATNALMLPDQAEAEGVRLQLPARW